MSENAIKGIMDVTMEKIRAMVDSDTIVGEPISLPNDITILPVSKVSFGFASGGSDLPSKSPTGLFAGGSGAGVTISPAAFLVVKGTDVRLLQVSAHPDAADRAISMVPDLIDRISELFKKNKEITE